MNERVWGGWKERSRHIPAVLEVRRSEASTGKTVEKMQSWRMSLRSCLELSWELNTGQRVDKSKKPSHTRGLLGISQEIWDLKSFWSSKVGSPLNSFEKRICIYCHGEVQSALRIEST